MILGILPMAGKAERWGGYYKEFLPFGDRVYTVDFTLNAMKNAGATRFCIITNPDKIQEHARHFKRPQYSNLEFFFVLQKEPGLFGALKSSFPYVQHINLFGMPDTLVPVESFSVGLNLMDGTDNMVVGTFLTNTPKRFGCFLGNTIVDKPDIEPDDPYKLYKAWGNFIFKSSCNFDVVDFDSFLNKNKSLLTYNLRFYYDMSNFSDYINYLERLFAKDENTDSD